VLAVRKATAQDAGRLREIAVAAFAKYVPRIGVQPAPMTADYDAEISRGEVWVAIRDEQIVGYIVLMPQPDHLLLDNIGADPAQHKTGVGTRLLEVADEQAVAAGLTEIRLYTHLAMTENQAYYPRHGYVETHRSNESGYDRVYYSKRL
jgi:ribosomal protein S18 acetylase RimI-like enzyme